MNQKKNRKTIRALLVLAVFAAVLTLSVVLLVRVFSRPNGGTQPPQADDAGTQPPALTGNTVTYGTHELPELGLVERNGYDPALFRWEDGRLYYDDPETPTWFGIDVSAHREELDWQAIRAAGVDFAMLRVGWRGNTEGVIHLDDYFEQNYVAAKAAGLHVGVYFYSQAVSREEAVAEAQAVLDWLDGRELEYPVAYDWEYVSSEARTANVDGETLDACANAFCETIAAGGYYPVVYFYQDIAYLKYNLNEIGRWDFWLAEYNETPSFHYHFQMLQYTSSGRLQGVEDGLDFNLSFVDYAKIVKG